MKPAPTGTVCIVSHDAGGAEILASYAAQNRLLCRLALEGRGDDRQRARDEGNGVRRIRDDGRDADGHEGGKGEQRPSAGDRVDDARGEGGEKDEGELQTGGSSHTK